jgi:hypothetical protein
MNDSFRSALTAALACSDIPRSIAALRHWLMRAEPGEPEVLLRETFEAALRPRLVLLMRDLLSRYPSTILGAPVLLLALPDSAACHRQLTQLSLPFPTLDTAQPCADLHFLGWLPMAALLPVALPFRPEHHPVEVPWFKPTAAIAVFRSQPGVFDLDSIELPSQWWGEVFRPTAGNIRLTSHVLMPYPDALEAARVLHAAANAEALPAQGPFLSDAAWHWAHSEGVRFHETYRHMYSDEI